MIKTKYFKEVDSLEIRSDQVADDFGIQKYTLELSEKVEKLIHSANLESTEFFTLSSGPRRLVESFRKIRKQPNSTSFGQFIDSLKSLRISRTSALLKTFLMMTASTPLR
ncbi:MAG: hypothetical protein ACI9YU_001019 [Flavobacteriales bacterium]|jgi:hypothetical protein